MGKAKVGILTFHNAINYGAALQTYALYSVLSGKYDTYVLDYNNDKLHALYYDEDKILRRVVKFCLYPKMVHDNKTRIRRFRIFVNDHLHLSKPYDRTTIVRANDSFDAFVVGSDQVWNLRITGEDTAYFLDFADNKKKFSYAASFGGDPKLFDQKKAYLRDALSTFNSLLLRENDAVGYLQGIDPDLHTTLVCDPVFLLNRAEWKKIVPIAQKQEEYVFVYIVGKDTNAIDFAKEIAEKEHLKIKIIQLYKGHNAYVKGTISEMDSGPLEFLNLIMNAKYVVTTSFHAMAFSLIFNVEFYYELSYDANNKNSRIQNLAEIFSVQQQEIRGKVQKRSLIDWISVNKIISEYSNASKHALMDSLKIIEGGANAV